jgi:fructan beta-fructosidase
VTEETDSFGFRVRVGQNEFAEIRYSAREKELTVDRTRAGCVNFKAGFARAHCADLMPVDGHIRLHIFVDAFSIEVFANDGLVVFSESIFPAAQSKRIELFAQGGNVFLRSLDLYQIKPARFEN